MMKQMPYWEMHEQKLVADRLYHRSIQTGRHVLHFGGFKDKLKRTLNPDLKSVILLLLLELPSEKSNFRFQATAMIFKKHGNSNQMAISK